MSPAVGVHHAMRAEHTQTPGELLELLGGEWVVKLHGVGAAGHTREGVTRLSLFVLRHGLNRSSTALSTEPTLSLVGNS